MPNIARIRIVNLNAWGIGPDDGDLIIRVDRRANSPLANPIVLQRRRDPAERDRVIDEYERILRDDIANNGPMSAEIERIAHATIDFERDPQNAQNYVALACWCAPLRCHAESVREALIERIERLRQTPRTQNRPRAGG